jgi:sRNA-binding carbon storage regulator CsrA
VFTLPRKKNESIIIYDNPDIRRNVVVTVINVHNDEVVLQIEYPDGMTALPKEEYDAKHTPRATAQPDSTGLEAA